MCANLPLDQDSFDHPAKMYCSDKTQGRVLWYFLLRLSSGAIIIQLESDA